MGNELDKNYQYFEKHFKEIKKQYLGEYILIYNEKIKGHNKDIEKILEMAKGLEAGTYIVKKCEEEDEIQMFHSRVWI